MNLYFLRHGIAVSDDEPGVIHESQRPLTDKGVKRLRRAARGLRRLGIDFDLILTSPLLRARQSADIVAATLGMASRLEEISGLAPESSVEHLLFGLTRYQDRGHVLLVGHQPLLGQTLATLVAGNQGAKLDFSLRKGSLCKITIDGLPMQQPATLHWLLSAKQLRLLLQRSSKD